ncbi:MAG TPA: DUF72 domain-containing protein, partial [Actinomycetes bacterium]|nr:DUF72 domain-containing protein [Actinomycetes bacterium]
MARQPDGGRSQGAVRVGTASWTDPTLLKSGWYPKGASDAESRLRFYATQFPIVEVDATYYYLPREEQAGLWVDRTPPDFVFNIKAFSLLTGHPTRRKALPEDLLDEVASEHRDKERFYASHLSADGQAEVWRRFRDALLPLDSAGKLGAVLLQYPEWFTPRRSSREELQAVRDRLGGYQVCVEFRNAAWLATDRDRDRTLGLLRDYDLPLVCVDMPQGFRSSVPPIADATSPALSVVRFHGRDPEAWKKKTVTERFRYLYKETELAEWVPKVDHLTNAARE